MMRKLWQTTTGLAALGLLTVLTAGTAAPAGEACCGFEPGAKAQAKTKEAATQEICDAEAGKQDAKANKGCRVTRAIDPYFVIRQALAGDSLDGVAEAATKLAKCAGCKIVKEKDNPLAKAFARLSAAATPLLEAAKAGDIDAARKAFHEVSKAAVGVVETAAKMNKLGSEITIYGCGMSKPFGKWLQRAGTEMGNPYQGKKMLTCGKPVRTVGKGAKLEQCEQGDKSESAKNKKDCCKAEN